MSKIFLSACAFALSGLLPACKQAPPHDKAAAPTAARPQLDKELRAELLRQEQHAPQRYLAATGASYRTPQGRLVLQGHLVSLAAFASYQNPVLLVTWFSKSYTRLGVRRYPVRALVRAEAAVPFQLYTEAPASVVSVGLGIADAAAVPESDPARLP
ncbi:MAG TPA: hypothetical protein VFO93_06880 [Hymenobacter sp.]|uniref:hypothetical protein n=1 Tax=Hymenobacter sp. TaxID=1898978 RepID=UPI002D80C800|nr:hypothetical protein [Hymenobacter sp.]HET9503246.1 hypothetical protein [Hymenobacter sp.]